MQHRQADPIMIIGHDILSLGLAAMLRGRGRRVIVRGGEPKDTALLFTDPRPAAIILDLMVARRDDFAVLRRVRAMTHLLDVPTLVLSPGTLMTESVEVERRIRALGARALLTPHDLDAVLNELERSLAAVA